MIRVFNSLRNDFLERALFTFKHLKHRITEVLLTKKTISTTQLQNSYTVFAEINAHPPPPAIIAHQKQ